MIYLTSNFILNERVVYQATLAMSRDRFRNRGGGFQRRGGAGAGMRGGMANPHFRNQNQPFQNRGPPQPGPALTKQPNNQPNQTNQGTPPKPQGPAGQPGIQVQPSPNTALNKTPTPQASNANAGPPKIQSPPPVKKDFSSPQSHANNKNQHKPAAGNDHKQGVGLNKPQPNEPKSGDEQGDQPQVS